MDPDLLITIAFCVYVLSMLGVALLFKAHSREPVIAGPDLPAPKARRR